MIPSKSSVLFDRKNRTCTPIAFSHQEDAEGADKGATEDAKVDCVEDATEAVEEVAVEETNEDAKEAAKEVVVEQTKEDAAEGGHVQAVQEDIAEDTKEDATEKSKDEDIVVISLDPQEAYSRAHSLASLKRMCLQAGLSSIGNKLQLTKRLFEANAI